MPESDQRNVVVIEIRNGIAQVDHDMENDEELVEFLGELLSDMQSELDWSKLN